jgi:hypothetical protein
MTIKEIYKKFLIPPILQEHMLRTAKIVIYIKIHWSGPVVDWDRLITAALLHDLGNVVRLKADSSLAVGGEEKIQKVMAAKYGTDDHEATRNMLREINADSKIIDWILSKSFANAEEIAVSGIWENKVLLYSDMRVLPFKIGTLQERIDELKQRRKNLTEEPTFNSKIEACQNLEAQIQNNLDISVSTITNESVSKKELDLTKKII